MQWEGLRRRSITVGNAAKASRAQKVGDSLEEILVTINEGTKEMTAQYRQAGEGFKNGGGRAARRVESLKKTFTTLETRHLSGLIYLKGA